jgi:hypothetical protein
MMMLDSLYRNGGMKLWGQALQFKKISLGFLSKIDFITN